ncbi:hypothetical protein DM02DRAFT_574504 [Periconia macrospinosa]|uniref:DUF7730 domain-containing protein n=1 Tax=Periconia macrospinosa TaxID=97972 RepID=A0A2V1D886_9PLEO|nr:hypothetical protein DM02DRAFT_574504 [Periconia macrospinosa]
MLSAWVKKYLLRSHPALPWLPKPRRPITPESFATAACLLFQLPWEIRSIILSLAFGGRTLHVDLVRQDGAWQWRGLVCDRNDSYVDWDPLSFSVPCVWGNARLRHRKLRQDNWGVMGFLLSCRQAYAQGIDFLYSANRIHIQSQILLYKLPCFIPTNRLASITSLEIVVKTYRIEQENKTALTPLNLDHLQPILDNIVTHCHSLRIFYLAFSGVGKFHDNSREMHSREILDGAVLPMLDAFYHSMQLRAMRFELPDEIRILKGVNTWRIVDFPREREAPAKECLNAGEPTVESIVGLTSAGPHPPLKLPLQDGEDDSVGSDGYWFVEGDEGPKWPYMVCL